MTEQNVLHCPVSWKPYKHQLAFLNAMYGDGQDSKTAKQKAFLLWGRQQGKDTVCGIFMFRKALEVPGNYFYIFPTSTLARRAFWEKVDKASGLRLIDQLPNHPDIIEGINNQEMVIRLKNNSTIRILGLDTNPEAARGISPAGVAFSECAYMDPQVFAAIEPAIVMNKAWVIYNTTPNGRNHAYKMFTYAMSHPEEWFTSIVQSRSETLPGYVSHPEITQDYIQSLIDSGLMTEEDVDREYGCNFATELRGSYYSDQIQKARQTGRVGQFPYKDAYPVNTYWDLGGTDATAIWFAQQIDGRTVFIDYLEGSGRDPLEDILDLKEKGYQYNMHILPHDAAQRHKAASFKSLQDTYQTLLATHNVSGDVVVLDKPSSVQEGITAVRRRFGSYYFNEENCSQALDLLELYHKKYDRARQVFLKDPQHDASSHCADALRSEAGAEAYSVDPFFKLNDIEVISDFDPFRN